jgi:hypothetical protein
MHMMVAFINFYTLTKTFTCQFSAYQHWVDGGKKSELARKKEGVYYILGGWCAFTVESQKRQNRDFESCLA